MKNRLVQHDNWATPKEVYNKLNAEFKFDFDPCPLDFKQDGTLIEWGKSNFINPPYSRKLKEAFIRKAFEENKKGKVCVMLLPVSTSTKIFHEIILPNAEIRFWKGRINFLANGQENDKYKAGQMDSMIVIFNSTKTKENFTPNGVAELPFKVPSQSSDKLCPECKIGKVSQIDELAEGCDNQDCSWIGKVRL